MNSKHPLRTLAASKLTLLGCILMSVSAVASTVLAAFNSRPMITELLNELLNNMPSLSAEELAQVKSLYRFIVPISLASGVIFSLVLASIPAVSLFLIYFSARSTRTAMKTIGFSIQNVYLFLSICGGIYTLVFGLLSSIGQESFSSIVASTLESLVNIAMLLTARKLLLAARDVTKTGQTGRAINPWCSTLIILHLCITAGTLLLQIFVNLYPNPVGLMRDYLFEDMPTMITSFILSTVSIAQSAVFYVLSRKSISAIAYDAPTDEKPTL